MHFKITCIILISPSITTITVFQSLLSSRLQNGFRTPFWTIVVNCCTEPPDVKFVTAHAASFWDLKSPYHINTQQVQLMYKNEHVETLDTVHITNFLTSVYIPLQSPIILPVHWWTFNYKSPQNCTIAKGAFWQHKQLHLHTTKFVPHTVLLSWLCCTVHCITVLL
jgi:hypothetical protein